MKIRLSMEELQAIVMERFAETATIVHPGGKGFMVLHDAADKPIYGWYAEITVDAPRDDK